MATSLDYPAELEQELTLRDGSVVRIRPIRPDDAPRLQELHSRLSNQTAYQRFFTVVKRLPPDWARVLATVDYQRRLALVVEPCASAETGLIAVGNQPLRIGGNNVSGEFFNGLIDEVRIYNRALSAAEIAADMVRPIQ